MNTNGQLCRRLAGGSKCRQHDGAASETVKESRPLSFRQKFVFFQKFGFKLSKKEPNQKNGAQTVRNWFFDSFAAFELRSVRRQLNGVAKVISSTKCQCVQATSAASPYSVVCIGMCKHPNDLN